MMCVMYILYIYHNIILIYYIYIYIQAERAARKISSKIEYDKYLDRIEKLITDTNTDSNKINNINTNMQNIFNMSVDI